MPRPAPRLLLFAACCAAHAQTAAPKLEFEVVSLKLSPEPEPGKGRTVGCRGGPGTDDPGMFRCQNMSLRNLITRAYSLNSFQVTAPEWLGFQMFEISAKVPEGATKEQFPVMLQNMLVDRFKLAVHHESKETAKYDLVVAKGGPKIKEAVENPAPTNSGKPAAPYRPTADKEGYPVLAPGRPGMAIMNGRGRMYNPKESMEMLAGFLISQVGKPVTDATGLKGQYEISLYWASNSVAMGRPSPQGAGAQMPAAPEPGDGGPTLMSALQDQLGLRLEAKKGPVDFLVVDHIEKLPTDN